MNNQQAYNQWAGTYDTAPNKTRDLEEAALRHTLSGRDFAEVLEIGCGTGKNTAWLLTRAKHLIGADFSVEMLARAREKIQAAHVEFRQLDLRETWPFGAGQFELITCSLVLEHLADLDFVFQQAHRALQPGGRLYLGELHPFKQYQGSKARFETGTGVFELDCFVHHASDFFGAASRNGFACIHLNEWFDEDDRTTVPRLLTMVFEKR